MSLHFTTSQGFILSSEDCIVNVSECPALSGTAKSGVRFWRCENVIMVERTAWMVLRHSITEMTTSITAGLCPSTNQLYRKQKHPGRMQRLITIGNL
ncbi:hypothetical protein M407DRAFT_17314 [Tulasnella calospora MUT 4182]|uniref:Uncharacterized protein n=1 Tax=Tulasnella calospora MUT 4182 TaxID=1051891 RepID=A0A0C3MK16_9AGAM|nr:hypothetical protein M407DRAFT_17314 [Tulasnella calospora MUT 4182]